MSSDADRALIRRLPRTWGAFFGRYGSFTPIQSAGIPLVLDGRDVLLCAGTASGKTEAALAPLVERHLPANRATDHLRLVYLLPTRALVNDLTGRLAALLERLRVRWAVRTRDDNTFDPRRPTDVLLTTPESLDSLMSADGRLLAQVSAVVIDELHLFDSSVRGDHLRLVLRRLRALRAYAAANGDTDDSGAVQAVGLSATLAQPAESAARYLNAATVVETGGRRAPQVDLVALEDGTPYALVAVLNSFRQRGWKKALAFCNTRAEVEQYAAHVRAVANPFGGAVYVHYSNIERDRRREIEELFAQAEAAICFASSTLELGIDIGSIDAVLLVGAPGSAEAFAQRVGRSGRRQRAAYAVCFYRTPLEQALFEVLAAQAVPFSPPTPFRPSVVVQQVFSLLKASPTGALRLRPTAALFDGLLTSAEVESVLGQLQAFGYLKPRRPGEWAAGERLNRLIDQQATDHAPFSLYSNLENSADTLQVRDRDSQRLVATLDRLTLDDGHLVLEGRRLAVEWVDGQALWVSSGALPDAKPLRPVYRSARPVLGLALARSLPIHLGLDLNSAPYLPVEGGWLWFHALGDVYGRAVVDLLRYTVAVQPGDHPGLCAMFTEEPRPLPAWTAGEVTRCLHDHLAAYTRVLALGAYHSLLPAPLRRRAVVEQFDVARFLGAVGRLRVEPAPESAAGGLLALVDGGG